jgi:hypothetical protein
MRPTSPDHSLTVKCRRCRKPTERDSAVPFTLYVAGDVATWICAPCCYALFQLAEELRAGMDVNHPLPQTRSQRKRKCQNV